MNNQRKNWIWTIHLACCTALVLLLVDVWRQYVHRRTTALLAASMENSIKGSVYWLEESNYALLDGATRINEAYRTTINQQYWEKACAAIALADSCQQILARALTNDKTIDGFNVSIKRLDTLWQRLFLLVKDAGGSWEEFNDILIKLEKRPVSAYWSQHLYNKIPTSEQKLMLRSLQLYSALACKYVMQTIATHISYSGWWMTEYEPILVSRQIYQLVGQPYEADVFMGRISRSASRAGTRCWVNGREIPFARQKFQYEQVFDHPGTYPLHVRAEVIGPRLGQVRTYQHDFEVNVLPSADPD